MSEKIQRAEDRKGGPGHVVLLSVLFAVPVLKLAWTLGGGAEASEAFLTMEPANWPDVLIGMLLNEPVLAAVLAVVVSRLSYAYFAARGGAQLHPDASRARAAGSAAIGPAAFALVMWAFHGWCWGLLVGVVAYALRLGVVVEYRTGRRDRGTGRRTGAAAHGAAQRAADLGRAVTLVLACAVLPVLALAGVLDGKSWTSVSDCTVDTGGGERRARLVELGRQGNGVVGWDIAEHEVVNGLNCGSAGTDRIRDPWWRG